MKIKKEQWKAQRVWDSIRIYKDLIKVSIQVSERPSKILIIFVLKPILMLFRIKIIVLVRFRM